MTEDNQTDEVPESQEDASPAPLIDGIAGLDKAQIGISAFLVAAVGLVAYFGTVSIPFHLDEERVFVQGSELNTIWTSVNAWDLDAMRPVAALSLALNWQLGHSVAFLHVINVLIHLANGILVYLLCRRVLRGRAPEAICMVAGMLFVVHPAATQAVDQLLNRSILLGTFFVLLSLVFYLRATQSEEGARPSLIVLSLGAFVLAWGSVGIAWIVPPVLVLLDLVASPDRSLKNRLATRAPYWVALACLLVLQNTVSDSAMLSDSIGASARALQEYAVVALFPFNLLVSHPPFEFDIFGIPYLWIVCTFVAAILIRFLPVLGLALLLFLMGVAAPGVFVAQDVLLEQWLYLPIIGLVLIAPWLLNAISIQPVRQLAGGVCALLILACVAMTSMRNNEWRSEGGIWIEANEACPECYPPIERLAFLHLQQAEAGFAAAANADVQAASILSQEETQQHLELSQEYFETATASSRASAQVWMGKAQALNYLGKSAEAVAAAQQALNRDPENAEAPLFIARLLARGGGANGNLEQLRTALDYFQVAAEAGPIPQAAQIERALLLAGIGANDESAAILSALVADDTTGTVQQMLNQVAVPLQQRQAIATDLANRAGDGIEPEEMLTMRARASYLEGRYLQSSYLVQELVRQRYFDESILILQALNYAKMGTLQPFLRDWPKGPSEKGDSESWTQLAGVLASENQWEAVLEMYQHLVDSEQSTTFPHMALAELAESRRDYQRAGIYFQQAAEVYPDEPGPWIGIARIAIATNQRQSVPYVLEQAQQRGATDEAVAEIRKLAGIAEPDADEIPRTIIR